MTSHVVVVVSTAGAEQTTNRERCSGSPVMRLSKRSRPVQSRKYKSSRRWPKLWPPTWQNFWRCCRRIWRTRLPRDRRYSTTAPWTTPQRQNHRETHYVRWRNRPKVDETYSRTWKNSNLFFPTYSFQNQIHNDTYNIPLKQDCANAQKLFVVVMETNLKFNKFFKTDFFCFLKHWKIFCKMTYKFED